ncbi:MAG: hypothetical protein BAA04_13715 [Firmicutes bacterium ZCTH02-B6]|nr:MAG: hypothetical protein BAA04_13715 [Firmicutes bacterium ZCTH02-B6]
MRRSALFAVVLAVCALALVANPAPAAAQNVWVAVGASLGEGESQAFLTGEVSLSGPLTLGLEYQANEVGIGARWGQSQGLYGQLGLSEKGTRAEVGVWGSVRLSNTIEARGWLGASSYVSTGDSKLEFTGRAEAYVPFADSLFALIGVDGVFVDGKHKFLGRVGIGTTF